ncbi:MAG: hypothetical protein HC780_11785 [Leptolyngbyaceae cyanobacterium CSU_1_3]|nr:hypothetical protein [Leptolyngbyaceae cyanobacterium CSU_1_3]
MYSSTPQSDEASNLLTLHETLPTHLSPQSVSHSLFAQLRSRFPTGALSSELVQVHDGQFVVRSIVQVSGSTLATGMAAADRIEVAEDRARLRAMEVLGIAPSAMSTSDVASAFEMQARLMSEAPREPDASALKDAAAAAAIPAIAIEEEAAPPTIVPPRSRGKKKEVLPTLPADDFLSTFPGLEALPAIEMPIEMEYEPEEFTSEMAVDALPDEPLPSAKATVPAVEMRHQPIDLSDAIAQIGAEIERIGWTKKQGSTYLQETYGKKTRAELTEDELLEFLHYLKALPSKGQASLGQIPF